MMQRIKANLPVIIGLSIPVLMIAIIATVIYGEQRFSSVPAPTQNFVYAIGENVVGSSPYGFAPTVPSNPCATEYYRVASGTVTAAGEALYFWLAFGVDPMRVIDANFSLVTGIRPAVIVFDRGTASPKVGVLWSNQNDKKMYFAIHLDGMNEAVWAGFGIYVNTASSPSAADDHINIKLQSDGVGVYAVTKTSNSVGSQPGRSPPTMSPSRVNAAQRATRCARIAARPEKPPCNASSRFSRQR